MIDLTKFKALSFDVYGTLIDWEAGIGKVLTEWARRHGSELTQEELLLVYADHEARVERDYPTLLYPEVLQSAFRGVASDLDLPLADAETQALGISVPEWPAFADSADALQRLSKHYKLIILSNVHREGFAGSNKRLGVNFDRIHTAQDIGSYKPNPRNFEYLISDLPTLDVASDQLLHVAQSLFHDHVQAKNFGLSNVWINRRHDTPGWGATPNPGELPEVDLEFKSMADFADAVDAAFEQNSGA